MTSLRGTKRRLDLESDSPEPAETLTTEGSFVTAEEGTLPPVSSFDDDDDDMTEVSSPARPGRVRKWSKQVKRLNEGKEVQQITATPYCVPFIWLTVSV